MSGRVFVCYSSRDERARDDLIVHLRALERAGKLRRFVDVRIEPGSDWRPQIEGELERCTVAILLVSEYFLDAPYVNSEELPLLLHRHNDREVTLLAVHVRASGWAMAAPELGEIQWPLRGRPVLDAMPPHERSEALTEVAKAAAVAYRAAPHIRPIVDALQQKSIRREDVERAWRGLVPPRTPVPQSGEDDWSYVRTYLLDLAHRDLTEVGNQDRLGKLSLQLQKRTVKEENRTPSRETSAPPDVSARAEKPMALLWPIERASSAMHTIFIEEITADKDSIDVRLAPDGDEERDFLERLRAGHFRRLCFAHDLQADLVDIERVTKSGTSTPSWQLFLRLARSDRSLPTEVSVAGLSADDIANLRARLILLGEAPQFPSTGFAVGMLEHFVRAPQGAVVSIERSPLPVLYREHGHNKALFESSARLCCVALLRLSNTIETIIRLRIELQGTEVAVDFKGRRYRQYVNAEPAEITVTGMCKVAP